MRFVEHYNIAKEVSGGHYTIPYLLGSCLPDWFERFRLHRTKESLDIILNRIELVKKMQPGVTKDYLLGTIMHYLCDFSCYAHSDKYYDFLHHRIFEVKEQKYFKHVFRKPYMTRARFFYNKYHNKQHFIEKVVMKHDITIENLNCKKWWNSKEIMKIDLVYAYRLCYYVYQYVNYDNTITYDERNIVNASTYN